MAFSLEIQPFNGTHLLPCHSVYLNQHSGCRGKCIKWGLLVWFV